MKHLLATLLTLLALGCKAQLDTCHHHLDFFRPYSDWSYCGATLTPSDTAYSVHMGLVDPIVMTHGTNARHIRIHRFTSDAGCPTIYRPAGERCYP